MQGIPLDADRIRKLTLRSINPGPRFLVPIHSLSVLTCFPPSPPPDPPVLVLAPPSLLPECPSRRPDLCDGLEEEAVGWVWEWLGTEDERPGRAEVRDGRFGREAAEYGVLDVCDYTPGKNS